ncbi:LOG family protein [Woeseia oceani]|uniref:Cytokinin riboside 5'-monophosphate phosphoribohydrolase n=1 Tax=Woeseia oceani TaxID=1548547 RepID=A0A193LIS6_9GAMM|nr:TIGR00730 family Rossman fold protein [Woeseia oceani]ANO52376.1 Rossman fold protein, TIGR00730 family [Woeseia oceani]
MKAICVYCGSSPGIRDDYTLAAKSLAVALTERDLALVYGGASKGIMGVLADAVLERGGRVIGVIPQALRDKEIAHPTLSELHVVASMHERKALMAELADGFIALPGGFGTLEEIIETVTWAQLGFHSKPCGLLNIAGYYEPLLAFIASSVREGFVRDEHQTMLMVEEQADSLLENFASYQPVLRDKWQR